METTDKNLSVQALIPETFGEEEAATSKDTKNDGLAGIPLVEKMDAEPCTEQDFLDYRRSHSRASERSTTNVFTAGHIAVVIVAVVAILVCFAFSHKGLLDTLKLFAPSKEQILMAVPVIAIFAVWFGTPISEWIVDILLAFLPIEDDIQLEEGYRRRWLYNREVVQVPYYSSRLREVANILQKTAWDMHPNTNRYRWEVRIIKSSQVNAHALPGGLIEVTTGLLEMLHPTDGELAALIGHEMGHVLYRHSQRRILQKKALSTIIRFLREGQNKQWQYGMSHYTRQAMDHAEYLGEQGFSRRDEYQADGLSWELLNHPLNEYNPRSTASLLIKIAKLEKCDASNDGKTMKDIVRAFCRTHPYTTERIATLEEKWQMLDIERRDVLSKKKL